MNKQFKEKQIYGYIYLIRNKINNKIYVGQTTRTFKERYCGCISNTRNKHLRSSINKYGLENFEIDEEFDIAYSKEELDKLEDMYIKMYSSYKSKYGYNKKFGGSNGVQSEETRRKMSEIKKGTKLSKEVRQKISKAKKGKSNAMYGRNHSEVTKLKISNSQKGENNPMYGKQHTEETKEKMRRSNSGKNNATSRAVVCLETGFIAGSYGEMERYYELSKDSVGKYMRGVRNKDGVFCKKLNMKLNFALPQQEVS